VTRAMQRRRHLAIGTSAAGFEVFCSQAGLSARTGVVVGLPRSTGVYTPWKLVTAGSGRIGRVIRIVVPTPS
jgi:hypothetical protein